VSTERAAPSDHFWMKNRKGERFRCDTRFKAMENWSVDPKKPAGQLFFEWLRCAPRNSLICRSPSKLRFWGWEIRYDESVACIRRGGIIPRTGKSAPKGKNPVASTSTHPQLQEPPDDEQEEEADWEAVLDEFDADWSGDSMCVADPFVVTKVSASPLSR